MAPVMRSRPWALLSPLVLSLLAGCADPGPGPLVLLQETQEVGFSLGAWHDDYYSDTGQELVRRTIKVPLDVPSDVQTFGVRFSGKLVWENATLNFSLVDPNGDNVVVIPAAIGKRDDFGTIQGIFQFERTLPARPGDWTAQLQGRGKIHRVDIQVWGIEERTTAVQRFFDVSDADRDVKATVLLDGWGPTPQLTLTYPNGTARSLAPDRFGQQAIDTFDPPEAGRYTLRADTTDWGGRVTFLVKQGA